ncbi:Putative zn(2)Cys(6) fungal-type DNA-binding domain-containing protein [Colletotrichum destructivum]|uniref:Zn(2)Cys(6) fungal-type DNA-binding domain-containing protein n=1 Tax=Colletotrichum destructivum TaxID=34406 RepID=A0AAX4HZJ9_9PEZI|nr:Putative zn(2)Cys(6) fungal-type DNA-binding domain-containing protein [Colletotrichum destructivum]
MPKHRKSRLGCRECKERKVKCNESKPICIRCKGVGRVCSYQELVSKIPTPTSQASATSPLPSSTSAPSFHHGSIRGRGSNLASYPTTPASSSDDAAAAAAATPIDPRLLPESFFSETFSLFHFDLLLHFRGTLTDVMISVQNDMERMLHLTYAEALKAPYLMDQVLAFAAAHRSVVAVEEEARVLYQNEATQLQARAISKLGLGGVQVTEDNIMALFCFSLLIGQQTLFDAFSAATSIPTVLDKLVQCLTLHHGIRVIVAESIEKFMTLLQKYMPHDPVYAVADVTNLSHGSECDSLLRRLADSEMNEQNRGVYVEVVKILQYLIDSVRSDGKRRYIVIQEWPVRISQEYIALLQQRRPEALIILSYYAVLLHWARAYWTVGDSGRFLIEATSRHLGSYWADWLEWPNQELSVGIDEGS